MLIGVAWLISGGHPISKWQTNVTDELFQTRAAQQFAEAAIS